jgi:tetratricopeptide (TPR) repeat protein
MLRHNWSSALDLFLESGALDSSFYATLYAAAAVAVNVGRWNVVDSLVKVMRRSSESLRPLDRANYEYFQARLNGDLSAALVASREQARLAPGTMYHFMNGYEALRSNRPREVVDILSAMDPDRGMLRGWLSYWGILVHGRHLIGDHRQELVDVRTAIGRFPEFSDWVRAWEAKALAAGDEVPDLVRWLDSIPPPPSRRAAQRGVLMEIAASELWGHARNEASIDLYHHAIESYKVALREQPDDEEIAFNLGRSLLALGRTDEALSVARRLHARFPANVNYLGLLGTIEASRGERAEATEIAQRLSTWDEPYLFGRPSYWLAAIEAHGGDLDRAVERLSRAFQEGTPFWGYPNAPDFGDSHTDIFLRPLRSYRPYTQLVRPRD